MGRKDHIPFSRSHGGRRYTTKMKTLTPELCAGEHTWGFGHRSMNRSHGWRSQDCLCFDRMAGAGPDGIEAAENGDRS